MCTKNADENEWTGKQQPVLVVAEELRAINKEGFERKKKNKMATKKDVYVCACTKKDAVLMRMKGPGSSSRFL